MAMTEAGYANARALTDSSRIGDMARSVPVASPSRASSLVARYEGSFKHLADLCSQAERIADRILGSQPESGSTGQPQRQPDGLFEELEDLAAAYDARLARLQSTVSRLDSALS